jgi:glycosyltransferase involved in cell wall biosynthesis
LVYKKYADLANPLIKPLLLLDIAKIKKAEEFYWQKADKLIAVSNLDKKEMKREDVVVIPNGVDTKKFRFRDFQNIPEEKKVLFIGDFKWIQNRDAVEFILKEIWPKVKKELAELNKNLNLKLWIVGRNLPQSFKQFTAQDIIFDEKNKQETEDIFRKSFILLAPLRVAGGTSYKILEAMSSGVSVVTSSLGIESLEVKNGVHVLAADKADELANCVVDLATDGSLYKTLVHNSRNFVEEKFDWSIISDKLNKVYMSAAK